MSFFPVIDIPTPPLANGRSVTRVRRGPGWRVKIRSNTAPAGYAPTRVSIRVDYAGETFRGSVDVTLRGKSWDRLWRSASIEASEILRDAILRERLFTGRADQ